MSTKLICDICGAEGTSHAQGWKHISDIGMPASTMNEPEIDHLCGDCVHYLITNRRKRWASGSPSGSLFVG